jgi:hypothetical protein
MGKTESDLEKEEERFFKETVDSVLVILAVAGVCLCLSLL